MPLASLTPAAQPELGLATQSRTVLRKMLFLDGIFTNRDNKNKNFLTKKADFLNSNFKHINFRIITQKLIYQMIILLFYQT